jgi:AcrR family transcriptional regulator
MSEQVETIPRKSPRQRRSKATVDAILAATARVLVAEGYERASTNRVARVAGVSIGSLYQYFPNKEALVLAVIARHCEEMVGLLAQAVVSLADAPIPVAVRTYISTMLAMHRVDPALHRVLVQQVMHLGLEQLQAMQAATRGIVRGWLERHREDVLPEDLDMAAYVLVTMVEGLTHAALLEDPAPVDLDRLADEIATVVLRYLLGESPPRARP